MLTIAGALFMSRVWGVATWLDIAFTDKNRTMRYGFGVARPGALALLTFTALSRLCS